MRVADLLWTVGTLAMYAPGEAEENEKMSMMVGAIARSIPPPRPLEMHALGKAAYRRRLATERASTHDVRLQPSRFGCTPGFFEDVVWWAVDSGARVLPVSRALTGAGGRLSLCGRERPQW